MLNVHFGPRRRRFEQELSNLVEAVHEWRTTPHYFEKLNCRAEQVLHAPDDREADPIRQAGNNEDSC